MLISRAVWRELLVQFPAASRKMLDNMKEQAEEVSHDHGAYVCMGPVEDYERGRCSPKLNRRGLGGQVHSSVAYVGA